MNSKSEASYEPAAVNATRQFPVTSISHNASPTTKIGRATGGDSADTSRVAVLTPLRQPDWLPESVWPFQTSTLKVDGSNIAVTDVGEGPVLLFVHTGFWSFIWRDVIERLAPNFRCVCFDAPGTGQSDRLPTSAISLEKTSRALTAVILALDLNDVTLVVHDLGGPSGIAWRRPRFGADTRTVRRQRFCVEAIRQKIPRNARSDGKRAHSGI